MSDTAEAVFDGRAFRDTLGYYASGITVITGLAADEAPIGFTCQSFYSVSIEPPLVSFSVGVGSRSYPLIRDAGRFTVNVLAWDQCGLANQFGRGGPDKWAGVEWTRSPDGGPIIARSAMWLDCELYAEHPAGDHFIVVGQVKRMSPREWHTAQPLLYFQGSFRHLSPRPDSE